MARPGFFALRKFARGRGHTPTPLDIDQSVRRQSPPSMSWTSLVRTPRRSPAVRMRPSHHKFGNGRLVMKGSAALKKDVGSGDSWRGFQPGDWTSTINVRDFIVRNVTPYSG